MPQTLIRPLPADAYTDAIFAAYIGANLLNIHAIHGVHVTWIYVTLVDGESEDVIADYRYRLESDERRKPFHTGISQGGKQLMFDPTCRFAYFAKGSGGQNDTNSMTCLGEVVSA